MFMILFLSFCSESFDDVLHLRSSPHIQQWVLIGSLKGNDCPFIFCTVSDLCAEAAAASAAAVPSDRTDSLSAPPRRCWPAHRVLVRGDNTALIWSPGGATIETDCRAMNYSEGKWKSELCSRGCLCADRRRSVLQRRAWTWMNRRSFRTHSWKREISLVGLTGWTLALVVGYFCEDHLSTELWKSVWVDAFFCHRR